MKKIKKAFIAIRELIREPAIINYLIDENSVWQRKVAKKYNLPKGLPQIQPTDLFADFSDNLKYISFLGGVSLATDIVLLKGLCRRFKDATYFEIGTWRGETVSNVTDVAKECYTMKLTKKQLTDRGFPEKYYHAHAYFSRNLSNVTHIEEDSMLFDFAGLNKKFDVIFIDGDHHYEYVKSDTEKVFEHLIHENSIIVWHDYAFNPEKVRFEVMQGILDGMPKELHKNIYHVANTQCAIFIRGDFKSTKLEQYQNPKLIFEISLKSKLVDS